MPVHGVHILAWDDGVVAAYIVPAVVHTDIGVEGFPSPGVEGREAPRMPVAPADGVSPSRSLMKRTAGGTPCSLSGASAGSLTGLKVPCAGRGQYGEGTRG